MPTKRKHTLPPLDLGNETIGQRISSFRRKKGFTQTELAAKITITQNLVSDYEVGRTHLTDEMIIRFAKALNTSADEILGLKPSINNDKTPNLRIMKRLMKIENLQISEQKAILKTIDNFLKGATINN